MVAVFQRSDRLLYLLEFVLAAGLYDLEETKGELLILVIDRKSVKALDRDFALLTLQQIEARRGCCFVAVVLDGVSQLVLLFPPSAVCHRDAVADEQRAQQAEEYGIEDDECEEDLAGQDSHSVLLVLDRLELVVVIWLLGCKVRAPAMSLLIVAAYSHCLLSNIHSIL